MRPAWVLLLSVLSCVLSTAQSAEPLRFAALGDVPYSGSARERMPRWLREISATRPQFFLHVGDFKRAREVCSDALFADRYALFDAVAQPFIYTPGDNEWSDCDQLAAGGFDPIERLDKLREMFFARPESLGQTRLPVEQQAGAPENLRWTYRDVLFLTLNLPGGNNYGGKQLPSAEFTARNPIVLAWLRSGFDRARKSGARAVVVVFQADPHFGMHAFGMHSNAFSELLETLQAESAAFSGQVVAIHGDSHQFRFDQPLRHQRSGKRLGNFWRIEVPGYPQTGWVEVELDTEVAGRASGPAGRSPVRATVRWLN
jgi:hypothetical protein